MVQKIYDIIKAHGGEIKAETKEGEETEIYYSASTWLKTELVCEEIKYQTNRARNRLGFVIEL